jgi:hypothetical protein
MAQHLGEDALLGVSRHEGRAVAGVQGRGHEGGETTLVLRSALQN